MVRQSLPPIAVPLPSIAEVAVWMSLAEEMSDSIDSEALFERLWFELYDESGDNKERILFLEYLAAEGNLDETTENWEE